jgi:phage-related minor tail protein
MNIINIVPSTARDEVISLSAAEQAELNAWFSWVDSINDEIETAWDRLASLVDAGAV